MTSGERIEAVLNFQKPDRLPVIEWAVYWDKTIARWHAEGLPSDLQKSEDIRGYFGLDRVIQIYVGSFAGDFQWEERPQPFVGNEKDYDDVLEFLYPTPAVETEILEEAVKAQEAGAAIWFSFNGFFWHPRQLFGIEEHLYAFYDNPRLMNRMNEDNLEYLCRITEEICSHVSPQFMTFAEDMSYNHGPMISKALFDELQAPFYRKAVPFLKSKGLKVFVDTDGLVDTPVDWYKGVGFDGFLPLEKQAGVDVVKCRDRYPDLLLIGAFDKMCMNKGESAMRSEFERLLPVMRQGGYIPGVDHQTPPEVSLQQYNLYLELLREYCAKAVV